MYTHTNLLDHQRLPHAVIEPTPNVLVCLLGNFRLLRCGEPLDLPIAGKAMALLSQLGLHLNSGVPREGLLEALWPEQDAAHSMVSLNSLVYSVQRRLRDGTRDAAAVIYSNGCYSLNAAAGVSTDVARFDALADRGNRLAATGQESAATLSYTRAIELYRGDLCTGDEVYAVIERERLRASFLTILAWLADRANQAGDDAAALGYALQLLACDPCREDAHRVVMRAHVHRGERAQALRQYRLCEQALRREFEAPPEVQTTELFNRIRLDPTSI